ncbi:phosphoribosylaminoimidazole-succinocarboxamide synthase [Evansella vedderi]|uniref:Phosphoribosylaminoimidazole-succinocarboxamide synthase n=1 Tax=Evansella vedderi TaxID=38282 RepID=A0ABT9ZTA4_9BACI|nr:phosphoribosylaminoimidazole-succinocarboxamide synthase [Evansella vedderi]
MAFTNLGIKEKRYITEDITGSKGLTVDFHEEFQLLMELNLIIIDEVESCRFYSLHTLEAWGTDHALP